MRRLKIPLLILLLLWPGLSATVFSAEKPDNPNRTLKAGIFNFQGYHSKNEDDSLYGYGIDLLNLISAYSHLNFDLTGYEKSWAEMLDMLKNGEIDLVSSARRTPDREARFAFTLPVGRNQTILSKNVYNTHIHPGNYSTYQGIRIGAVSGSSQNKQLEDFAKEKGFTYELIEFDSPEKLSEALKKGDVDAILSSNLRKPSDETVLNVIRSDNFYIITRKEDKELIKEIDHAIQQMDLNEGDWRNSLYYSHYGPEQQTSLKFSPREEKFIESVKNDGKKITALARNEIPPYSFTEKGQLKGILPDYFTLALQMANLPFEFVIPENYEDYVKKAKSGEIDIILDDLDPNATYENGVRKEFSTEPYFNSGVAHVQRVNFKGEPKKIALSQHPDFQLKPEAQEGLDISVYPSPAEAMEAVRRGDADAAYILPLTAQMYLNRNPGSGLFYSILDEDGVQFHASVRSDANHELLTILKKTINRLPKATLTQLGTRYTSFDAGDMSLGDYLKANPGMLISGMSVIALALSLLLLLWLRGRWNRRLLATTEKANHELASQLAIVEALSRDYANVLSINPRTGKANIVKISDYQPEERYQGKEQAYAQLIGAYIREKVHPSDRKFITSAFALANIRKQLAAKGEFSGTYRVVEADQVQYFQFTFVKPDSPDNKNIILAGLRSIDDVMRKEQEQKKALSEALAQSRYASAAKTTFLNNMSHDIRTPMNAIIGFTSLASANVDNAPLVKRYLGKIMTSGNHLLSLINDVLDMSRIESGKVAIESKPVSLPALLRDLRTIVQADVKTRKLDFRIEALNVINEEVLGDKLRLNQVLLNILSNAMKYTNPGGKVRLHVNQLESEDSEKAEFEFRIIDNGIGMSAEFLKHVFEPFERERTSTISGIQGTGLGLTITSKLVDKMKGSIDVKSEVGKGSEFIVRLRFPVPKKHQSLPLPAAWTGRNVLVIDSDVESWESFRQIFTRLGLKPEWRPLGQEGLDIASDAISQKKPFDAYLIATDLADMNGTQVAASLREMAGDDVTVILVADNDWSDLEAAAKKARATAFYSRPVFLSDISNTLTGAASKPVETKKQQASFEGKRILLVEDNEMNQEIAQMILENAGFEIDIAENGQQAVDVIQKSESDRYDLILMDVQMPVMNGYDATRAIRTLDDPAKSGLPIIAMTANAFEEDREEAMNAGMNGHVPKPIDIKKLMETLEDFLK